MGDVTNFGETMSFDMKFDDPAQMARMLELIQGVDSKTKKPTMDKAWMKRNGFYRSKGEFGIKVLADDRFAVLYIPKGAVVHVERTVVDETRLSLAFRYNYNVNRFKPGERALRKHRADEAYVVALCKLVYEQSSGKMEHTFADNYVYCNEQLTLKTVYDGKSYKNQNFEYHTGEKLVIGTYDYLNDEACSQGVHYFTNAKMTLDYGYSFGGYGLIGRDKIRKYLMFTAHGAELLEPWMEKQIEQFKNGWGKDIYEEPGEDNDYEEPDRAPVNDLYEAADDAYAAIEKLVEALQTIKPAKRTDLGRYSDRYPARGTRCNCDAADDSDDRPP